MGFWQQSDESLIRETLQREADRMDIPLTDEKSSLLLKQLRLVLEANRGLNLTAIRDPWEAVIKHTVDSMTFYPLYHDHAGRYLDMGTGAGYPGMVLEILEPRDGVLLDSVAKKIDACRHIGHELGLSDIQYVAERVELFAQQEPEAFGVITARAVAPIGVLLEYSQPLLETGGILILSKGILGYEEEAQGEKVASLVGLECVSRETLELPGGAGTRTILEYAKTGVSKVQLPRSIGRATKQPLWKC